MVLGSSADRCHSGPAAASTSSTAAAGPGHLPVRRHMVSAVPGMLDEKAARLRLVAERVGPDEDYVWDVGAIWRENPTLVSRRDAEGFLVVTDRRLIYANHRVGVLVDLPFDRISSAQMTRRRITTAQLSVSDSEGKRMRFYTGKRSVGVILEAIEAHRS
jgi:hypothetical protein